MVRSGGLERILYVLSVTAGLCLLLRDEKSAWITREVCGKNKCKQLSHRDVFTQLKAHKSDTKTQK